MRGRGVHTEKPGGEHQVNPEGAADQKTVHRNRTGDAAERIWKSKEQGDC